MHAPGRRDTLSVRTPAPARACTTASDCQCFSCLVIFAHDNLVLITVALFGQLHAQISRECEWFIFPCPHNDCVVPGCHRRHTSPHQTERFGGCVNARFHRCPYSISTLQLDCSFIHSTHWMKHHSSERPCSAHRASLPQPRAKHLQLVRAEGDLTQVIHQHEGLVLEQCRIFGAHQIGDLVEDQSYLPLSVPGCAQNDEVTQ